MMRCRVVNFTTESLGDVLRKECPSGVDIVFESVVRASATG